LDIAVTANAPFFGANVLAMPSCVPLSLTCPGSTGFADFRVQISPAPPGEPAMLHMTARTTFMFESRAEVALMSLGLFLQFAKEPGFSAVWHHNAIGDEGPLSPDSLNPVHFEQALRPAFRVTVVPVPEPSSVTLVAGVLVTAALHLRSHRGNKIALVRICRRFRHRSLIR
jgi:hypothetical protein